MKSKSDIGTIQFFACGKRKVFAWDASGVTLAIVKRLITTRLMVFGLPFPIR